MATRVMRRNIIILGILLLIIIPLGIFLFVRFTHKFSSQQQQSQLQQQTSSQSSLPSEEPLPSVVYTPTPLPAALQDHTADQENTYNRQNQPDIFLSNNVPYENADFSITSDFSDTTQKFFFIIHLKTADQQQGQAAVTTWLRSLGLQDSQIAQLDLRYQ